MSDFLIDINPDMELPKYSLALHKLNEEPLSSLKNIKDIHYKAFFVGIDELSFNVPYHRMENNGDLVKNEIYGMVEGDHLIKLNDTKFFIVSAVNEKANEENGEKYKEVICYSREYELSQKKLVDYVADSRVLYDRHDTMLDGLEKGILNYIFNRITKSWTIGYVDPNVLLKDDKDVHRALNFSDSNLLQVFQELQKTFGCIFKFDTIEQKINVYAVESKTIQGQHRGLYISDRNFIKNIEKSIKSDEIKTRLYLYGKDNISIQSISPVGQPYIDNFDFYKNTKYMSQGLIDALNVYESKVESTNPDFKPLLKNLQQANGAMEVLINADHISDLDKKGLIALERYLSNIQTLIDVKTEELAINQSQIDKATGANLTALYNARKEIQTLLSGYNADKVNVNNFISTKKQQINSQQVIIDGIESNLRALQDGLDVESTSNFTKEQLRELDKFIRVETYNNSDYTEHNIHELYEEGKKTLARISQPAIQFDVDVVDFLSVVECQHVWDKFVKGDIVTLEHKEIGFNHDVRFISYEHDEGGNTLNLKFSNKNSFDDATLYLQELLEDFKTTGTIVDFNKDKWGQVGEVKSEIATLIDSKLEEARQNILNAVGQRYLHDDSGLWLYKENPDGAIDPAQIRGINSDIVLTDDNFASVKTAISAKDGINAELIRGKIGEFAQITANQILMGGDNGTIKWVDIDERPQDLVDEPFLTTELGKDYIITGKIKANQISIGGANGVISFEDLSDKPWIPQNASDIGAKPSNWVPSWSEIQSKPTILSADDIKTTVITRDWIGTLGLLVGSEIQMGDNAKISWGNVTDQPSILTDTQVTTITQDTIKTTNVEAVNLKVKSANIQGSISADSLKTTATINVGTDVYIGNTLYVGQQNTTSSKGINFYGTNTGIYSSGNDMTVRGSRSLTLTTSSSYITMDTSKVTMRSGAYTTLTLDNGTIDFNNRPVRNLAISSIQDQAYTSRGIQFRIYGNRLQYKATNSNSWTSLLE